MDQTELTLNGGYVLRVVHEVTVGDLLVAAAISALLFYMILDTIRRILWRR